MSVRLSAAGANYHTQPMAEPRTWPPGPVWVVVPTYNERENVEALVAAVRAALDSCAPDHAVLIVDDGSPDGTGAIADRIAERDPVVRVLHRERRSGLGAAYLAGFALALEQGAALAIEMDADFSHDPAYLARLIEAAADADLVLGSRYVEGGRVRNWGPLRRVVSRGGCWYARRVLGVRVRDLTGGFKCFRREVLEHIDLASIRSQGYAFQVELTYRALQAGFRVREVPITFTERRAGSSKMSRRIFFEAIWMVPRLRLARGPLTPVSRLEGGDTAQNAGRQAGRKEISE
jgi:dolichol-phosphate mannosyltransferase